MLSSSVQRFGPADLTTHARWMMPRLMELYPHRNEFAIATFLKSLCDRNDCLFWRQPHSVCLAEVIQVFTLDPKPILMERFVWCEDRQNYHHVEEAAWFYDHMRSWAASADIEKMYIERSSDVPHEKITERVGRLSSEKIVVARV
jgi:hypothetical protein